MDLEALERVFRRGHKPDNEPAPNCPRPADPCPDPGIEPAPADPAGPWYGYTRDDLAAIEPDLWPEIESRPEVLQAFARALSENPSAPQPGELLARPARPLAPVTCGTCRHFAPNERTPAAGLGRCSAPVKVHHRPAGCWPGARHHCRDWRPRDRYRNDQSTDV
ncbi:MAG: hypothetical protein GVY22_15660 [Gammaproteobacteria bacterium]|nr:hypothetical protein [Gammaproteobacteria bacterium]